MSICHTDGGQARPPCSGHAAPQPGPGSGLLWTKPGRRVDLLSGANTNPYRLRLAMHFPSLSALRISKHTPNGSPCLFVVSGIPSCLTLKPDCKCSHIRACRQSWAQGHTAGSWQVCAWMGPGAEPAGCVTPLPRERGAEVCAGVRAATACEGKPSWCPLMLSAWRGPEASSRSLILPTDK